MKLLWTFSVPIFGLFSVFLYSMEVTQIKIKKEHDLNFPIFLNHQDPKVFLNHQDPKDKILYLRALKNGGFKAGKRPLKVKNDSFKAMVSARKDGG